MILVSLPADDNLFRLACIEGNAPINLLPVSRVSASSAGGFQQRWFCRKICFYNNNMECWVIRKEEKIIFNLGKSGHECTQGRAGAQVQFLVALQQIGTWMLRWSHLNNRLMILLMSRAITLTSCCESRESFYQCGMYESIVKLSTVDPFSRSPYWKSLIWRRVRSWCLLKCFRFCSPKYALHSLKRVVCREFKLC